jgi:toxin CptA
MTGALAPAPFVLAVLLVALMGAAVQRGATCFVAAVDEILERRRARRLAAMLVAGLWVAGLLSAVMLAGGPVPAPAAHAVGWATVAGGALLGLGAAVNRACVFGSVARLGQGEWAFALTPLGFFGGCLLLAATGEPTAATEMAGRSAAARLAPFFAGLLAAWVALRLAGLARGRQHSLADALWRDLWRPAGATAVIGIAFALLMMFAGPWTWPETVEALASQPMTDALAQRILLFGAMLAGSLLGGRHAWTHRLAWPPAEHAARALAGGFLMALGSGLIPGSNDALVLLGLPMLWPFALVALLAMGATVLLIRQAERQWRGAPA